MGVLGALISEVEGAIDQVMQQASEAVGVKDAINTALNPIVGGAWTGNGAKAFINIAENQLIKAAEEAVLSITGLGNLIKDALEIIKEADAILSAPAEIVEGIFDAIF